MAHSHRFTKDLDVARRVSPYRRTKFRLLLDDDVTIE